MTPTPFAQLFIERLEPWLNQDLEIYAEGIGSMFDQVYELVGEEGLDGETGYVPAWGRLFSPSLCPGPYLPYLGQYVGVPVPVGMPEEEARELIKEEPGLERGTFQAVEKAAKRILGSEPFFVFERTALDGSPDAYHFLIITKLFSSNLVHNPSFEHDTLGAEPAGWHKEGTFETYAVSDTWAAIGTQSLELKAKLPNITEVAVTTQHGSSDIAIDGSKEHYWLEASFNTVDLKGCELQMGGGFTKVGGEPLAASFRAITTNEIGEVQLTIAVPAEAAFFRPLVTIVNETGSTKTVHLYVDKFQLTSELFPPYSDGDQPKWRWTGTPGNSASVYNRQPLETAIDKVKPGGVLFDIVEIEPVIWLEGTKTWEEVDSAVTWANITEGDV